MLFDMIRATLEEIQLGPVLPPTVAERQPSPAADSVTASEADDIAAGFRQKAASFYLHGSFAKALQNAVPAEAVEAYLSGVLRDAGDPRDPIECLLVEQLVLASHNVGQLYMRAAFATDPKEIEIFIGAAARLLGEFRRTALALKNYREPAAAPRVVVGQQNLVSGDQVAILAATPDLSGRKNLPATEVPLHPLETLDHGSPDRQLPVLEGDGREAAEETRPAQRRRSRTASAGRDGS